MANEKQKKNAAGKKIRRPATPAPKPRPSKGMGGQSHGSNKGKGRKW